MDWMTRRKQTHEVPRVGSISVNLEAYLGDHYVPGMEMQLNRETLYQTALPRILSFFDALQVRVTFFVVGKDVEDPYVQKALKDVVARGHEVASLSYSHAPNLRRWSKLSVAEEIEQSAQAIKQAIGVMPSGFRTPGYNVDTRILQLLAERGYKYDASVLPSLPYYLIKGGVSSISALIRGKHDTTKLAVHSLVLRAIAEFRSEEHTSELQSRGHI